MSSYDAVKIIFDNRLNASEIREETCHIKIPADVMGEIIIEARLNYLSYPNSFSQRFGLGKAEPFEIDSARKVIIVK